MTPAPPTPPPTPSSASSRAQHAERNVRLDPQGIYGTRSARRQNQLRRRRQFQNSVLWAFGALAALAFFRWALQPRHTVRAASQTVRLPFRPAGAPLALSDGGLLFTSQSGGLWRAETGSGEIPAPPRRLWSTAFAPGAAPLVTPTQIFWPGGDGTLAALDFATGKLQWSAHLPSALVTRPALSSIAGRGVLVAGDDAGNIAAFDSLTGALQWKKALGGGLGAGIAPLEAQRAAGATGAVGTGAVGTGAVGTGAVGTGAVGAGVLVPLMAGSGSRGGLVCLDAKTGAERWRFPGDARSQSAGMALPATLGNQVFWCNDEGAVLCLDGASGRKIWKSFAAPQNVSSGAAPPDDLPTASQATAASGEQLVMLRGAPTIVEAAGVLVVGGNDGTVRAFDLASGAARWTRDLGGAVRFGAQNLGFEGKNGLLVTGEVPALWVLDAADGSVLRRWSTPYPNSYGVAFARNHAYALDADGHLQIAPLN